MLYAVTEHLRMSGVYWGLCAMEIMQRGGDMPKDDIANWVMECFDAESGGFGGNAGHDPHMLYTLSAVQLMALCDQLHRVDAEKCVFRVDRVVWRLLCGGCCVWLCCCVAVWLCGCAAAE